MDVLPVVFASHKHYYFGAVHAQHLLEDPDVVIQGKRVLHLRYRVCRLDVLDGPVRYCRADPERCSLLPLPSRNGQGSVGDGASGRTPVSGL